LYRRRGGIVMKFRQIVILAIFLIAIIPFAGAQSRLHLLTELVDEKKQGTEQIKIITNKYYSDSSKEDIIKFYRDMFRQEGFSEQGQGGYPAGQEEDKKLVYVFNKPNVIVMINFLRFSEERETTYYISVYQMSVELIKPLEGEPTD